MLTPADVYDATAPAAWRLALCRHSGDPGRAAEAVAAAYAALWPDWHPDQPIGVTRTLLLTMPALQPPQPATGRLAAPA
jgi:hypothetical protein